MARITHRLHTLATLHGALFIGDSGLTQVMNGLASLSPAFSLLQTVPQTPAGTTQISPVDCSNDLDLRWPHDPSTPACTYLKPHPHQFVTRENS